MKCQPVVSAPVAPPVQLVAPPVQLVSKWVKARFALSDRRLPAHHACFQTSSFKEQTFFVFVVDIARWTLESFSDV